MSIRRRLEEYVLFFALFGFVTPGENTWLIDSGSSKHKIGKKKTMSIIEKNNSPQKVSLGYDYEYPSKALVNQATRFTLEPP